MPTLSAALLWLLLGLGFALLEWPYQALSELGFRLQRWGWNGHQGAVLLRQLPGG